MELAELQNIWKEYDQRTTENIRLNKEILKKMIQSKTERKMNWLKFRAVLNVLYPIPLLIFVAYDIVYRMDIKFYIGLVLFGLGVIITYSWAIKYYLLVDKIDFLKPVTIIKKDLSALQKFKLRITWIGIFLAPFMITGVLLIAGVSVFSVRMIPFDLLALLVMAVKGYLTYKHGILVQIKRIDSEIDEIIKIEQV
jgi:hypothetical protein